MSKLSKSAVLETAKKSVGFTDGKLTVEAAELISVPKYNQVMEGIQITLSGKVSPVIYNLEDFETEEQVKGLIENLVKEASKVGNVVETIDFTDTSLWRLKAVNYDLAEKSGWLEDKAYKKVMDLAIIPCVLFCPEDGEDGHIPVSKELLKNGCRTDMNGFIEASNMNDYLEMRDIYEMISIFDPEAEITGEQGMYVVNGIEVPNFATSLFVNEEKLRELQNMFGDYYIIPSSIHELLILPFKNYSEGPCCVSAMVKAVNQLCVEEKDFLSDHAYIYNGELIMID